MSPDLKRRQAMLEIMLDAVSVLPKTSLGALQSLWASEAANRASGLLHLMLLLNRRPAARPKNGLDSSGEYLVALNLAKAYRQLALTRDDGLVMCAEPLRNIVGGLTRLFGRSSAGVASCMPIQDIFLTRRKRRALTLIVSKLVIDMLKASIELGHGFSTNIRLDKIDITTARLMVEDDLPAELTFAAPGYKIMCDLAGVLDSQLTHGTGKSGRRNIEILFPVYDAESLIVAARMRRFRQREQYQKQFNPSPMIELPVMEQRLSPQS